MKVSRREWLKYGSISAGMAFLGELNPIFGLTLEEKSKFNPRPLEPLIKLGSNENPYGPSQLVREKMIAGFDNCCRYPWAYTQTLTEMIAAKEGVSTDHVVLTAGSTEGLKIAGLTYAGNGGEIISGLPTFLSLMNYAELWGASINWVPLDQDMQFDLEEMANRVSKKTKLVFLCNPNNPTGKLLPAKKVSDFCQSVCEKTMVFSDEAYYDYIEEESYPSMVELVKEGKNVIVSKTLSKIYGLAGIRIGYLIAKPEIAKKLSDRMVANLNIMAIEAAMAALEDQEFYKFSLEKNHQARKLIEANLDHLNLDYLPSQANFVFFNAQQPVSSLAKKLLDKNVIVGRPFPPYDNWCRISTGTIEEVNTFNQALTSIYG
ncbi:histidinol-phosphate aminotransferase family protein [Belliella sp. DSM 111904]|uniref:Histidinol-phosphate aminotransferase family protein n=1 Tax=Belliella filtrata TaxID=2923435 RepID=A0ABS9UWQ0_9BACT|nr:histidinol-phosphate transaminase [Belliella filtrata]MCH7408588.1 histidinol-phosphate aminotransferase family protein [Belliella filtrata]